MFVFSFEGFLSLAISFFIVYMEGGEVLGGMEVGHSGATTIM